MADVSALDALIVDLRNAADALSELEGLASDWRREALFSAARVRELEGTVAGIQAALDATLPDLRGEAER